MKDTKKKRRYTYRMQPIPRADLISKWVYSSGKTITELEEETGIHRVTLYRAMRGYHIRIRTLKKLARAMGLSDWKQLVKRW